MPNEFTANYGLVKPDFNISGWHEGVNGNFDSIDALIYAVIGLGNFVGEWTNSTIYSVQHRVFDPDDGTIWNCQVANTSASTGTFAEERVNNPTYWSSVSSVPIIRGAWQNDTVYGSGDVAYDTGESLIGIASATHTSLSAPNTMRDDIANWAIIADLSAAAVLVSSVNGFQGVVVLDADDIAETATNKFSRATDEASIDDLLADVAALQAQLVSATSVINRSIDSLLPPTGMMMPWPSGSAPTQVNGNGTTPSWLLCLGSTIGSATSGAILRANADMEPLFTFLWNNSANTELIIQTNTGSNTTRGGSAAADFAADKRMPLPDCRGSAFYFADDSAGRITVTGHSTNFAEIGQQNKAILQANLPNVTFPDTLSGTLNSNAITNGSNVGRNLDKRTDITATAGQDAVENFTESDLAISNTSVTVNGSVSSGGSGTPLATLAPGIVVKSAVIKT